MSRKKYILINISNKYRHVDLNAGKKKMSKIRPVTIQ